MILRITMTTGSDSSDSSDNSSPPIGAVLHTDIDPLQQSLTQQHPSQPSNFKQCSNAFYHVGATLLKPLTKCIAATCPDCRLLVGDRQNLYGVTFFSSFVWITFFSYVVTVVVERWVDMMQNPSTMGYFGLVLVAVGAEIPDTVNALTVARRGYGSMATSSCIGSQVCNICLGLGLPWTMLSFGGFDVSLGDHDGQMYLLHIALVMAGAVAINFLVLPGKIN